MGNCIEAKREQIYLKRIEIEKEEIQKKIDTEENEVVKLKQKIFSNKFQFRLSHDVTASNLLNRREIDKIKKRLSVK